MGGWLAIILLILVGLILIYLELIFIPGTTVLGVLGLILTGVGVYIAYDTHGTKTGSLVLAGAFFVTVIALVYSFKSRSWDRFALKGQNKSQVNEDYTDGLEENMVGTAISDLKPIGKAEFGDESYEVTTHGNHVDSGTEIRITSIRGNKIIVESTKS